MESLNFDTGIRQYKINGDAVLSFNPSDPNVYNRFIAAADKIQALEGKMTARFKEQDGENNLKILQEMDRDVKNVLLEVFPSNNFDSIFGGVNVMAVCNNGERVITNFFAALKPIIEAGVESFANEKAHAAVATAQLNRAQRRAQGK